MLLFKCNKEHYETKIEISAHFNTNTADANLIDYGSHCQIVRIKAEKRKRERLS
jgi:hypothetical protein